MMRQRISSAGGAALACFAVAAVLIVLSFLTGCSGGAGGNPALAPAANPTTSCWNAMLAQYRTDLATGATGTEPPECRGMPDATLQKFAMALLGGATTEPKP